MLKLLSLTKYLTSLVMNSTESKIGLLLEDAQTALERGVKRGAVKMDIQSEIRLATFCLCPLHLADY